MPTKSRNPETIVLHSGYRSDPTTTAVAVPIYQTTSYQFSSTEHAQTGVTDGYVRLSVGIEHIDDILADLDQAFAAV